METYLPQVFKCCLFNIHLRYWSYWHVYSWCADGECSLLRLAPQCLYLPSYWQQISNIAAGFNLLTLLQNRMVHFTSKMSCISMLLTVRHGFTINKRCPLYILNGHCSSLLNLQSFMGLGLNVWSSHLPKEDILLFVLIHHHSSRSIIGCCVTVKTIHAH